MKSNPISDKNYELDHQGFLVDHEQWDEGFALQMADKAGIQKELTQDHWKVIYFIRDSFKKTGKCPLVYQACRVNGLSLGNLKKLFPAGYIRGACRLAGLTYREGYVKYSWPETPADRKTVTFEAKDYEVDNLGFLIDPSKWDEDFAMYHARQMQIEEGLSEQHWRLIRYLRDYYAECGGAPTFYEFCEANDLGLEDCERLFPGGYHRGAVKMAGLRVR